MPAKPTAATYPNFARRVVVGYETLPEAGPGEVQVGEGSGPCEVTEIKKIEVPKIDLDDFVGAQPRTFLSHAINHMINSGKQN